MWKKIIRPLPIFAIFLFSIITLGFQEHVSFGQYMENVGDSGETGSSSQVYIVSSASLRGCETINSCYSPFEKHVEAGSTITWNNQDDVPHTITSGIPLEGPDVVFDSSLVQAGNTFSQTFDDPGIFPYFCMVHPWMIGKVVVSEKIPIAKPTQTIVEQPETSDTVVKPSPKVDDTPKAEKPTPKSTPTKIQKSVESIIPTFPKAMGDSSLIFQKTVYASKDLLVDTFADFRNYQVVFPDNVKSVKLVDGAKDIIKMDVGYSFVTFQTKIKRTLYNDDRYLFEVIEGDLKGSKMLATVKDSNDFSSIPPGNTLVNLETHLETSGLLSIVTLFVTDQHIKDGLGYGLDKFVEQAKNPKPVPAELEMDTDDDEFCFLFWCW